MKAVDKLKYIYEGVKRDYLPSGMYSYQIAATLKQHREAEPDPPWERTGYECLVAYCQARNRVVHDYSTNNEKEPEIAPGVYKSHWYITDYNTTLNRMCSKVSKYLATCNMTLPKDLCTPKAAEWWAETLTQMWDKAQRCPRGDGRILLTLYTKGGRSASTRCTFKGECLTRQDPEFLTAILAQLRRNELQEWEIEKLLSLEG